MIWLIIIGIIVFAIGYGIGVEVGRKEAQIAYTGTSLPEDKTTQD